MIDLVVVGGTNTDFVAKASRLPRQGEASSGEVYLVVPGGRGANQDDAEARLGSRVMLVSATATTTRPDAGRPARSRKCAHDLRSGRPQATPAPR